MQNESNTLTRAPLPLKRHLGTLRDFSLLTDCLAVKTTRSQLLAIGYHVDLSTLAEQFGFRLRVFIRREAFLRCIGEKETPDLLQVLEALHEALRKMPIQMERLIFKAPSPTPDGEPLELAAQFGAIDHDDPRPAITLSIPKG